MSVEFYYASCHVKICHNVSSFIVYCATSFWLSLLSNQCQLLLVSHSHTFADMRSRGAILQHLKARRSALLDCQTVTLQFWLSHVLAMNNNKLRGVFTDISFDKNNKKQFSELHKSEVKLLVTDQSPHIKFCFISTVTVRLSESKATLNAGEIKFYYNNFLNCSLIVCESFLWWG